MKLKSRLIKILDNVGFFNKIPRKRLLAFLEKHATEEPVLDLGGGSGPYRHLFPARIGVDITAGPGVDFVADAHDLGIFKDGQFKFIFSTEMLEHLYDPEKAVREMYRILAPGGKLILTTRFIFPLHDIPGDYFRFTRYGLAHLFRKFERVTIEEETGTLGAFAVLFERLAFQTDILHLKPLSLLWIIISKFFLLISPIITREYGDVGRRTMTSGIMSSGYYVVAYK